VARPAMWLVGVGCVLGVVAVIGWIWSEDVLPPAVFTGQAVACIAGAVLLGRRELAERARAIPDLSYSTIAVGLGAAAMLNGFAFGLWLVLIGAGIVAFGLGGLVREHLAARRAAR
jgi:hypothetical protein